MKPLGPALPQGAAPAPLAGGPWADAASAAMAYAPYLKRLMERREDLLEGAKASWPEQLIASAMTDADVVAEDACAFEDGMQRLRRAKDALHLGVAIADLSRHWPLARVTGAISDFADAALRAGLALGAREMTRKGLIAAVDEADAASGPVPGFVLIAMGKMGARELNYSSDIDFSVFFDSEKLGALAKEPRVAAVRLVAPMVRALEEITADGYVFRTDLRLRPDPGSTPVAVSIASAEHYYQNLGQNWERAAFIKARAAAGDIRSGAEFLASLEQFVWRRHLDFAAVDDVHSIKRQILSAHRSAELADPVFDLKLGRGGIRDIELFVQTQQLVLGGRNRALRQPGTLAALDALAHASAISTDERDALGAAYVFLREIEHRVQMLEDAQTHDTPADNEIRARLASLSGFASLHELDAALIETRRIVADIDYRLFGRAETLADPLGSLVFTGVEDNRDTLETLSKLGFRQPEIVSQTVRGWHHGRIRAMRSERARELLTRLTPRLLRAFGEAGEPDIAFARFSVFFGGLNAGVQVLSLLDARPALLKLLADVLASAPRLAESLAQRPVLLDAMIEPGFARPVYADASGDRARMLEERLSGDASFEEKLNTARRFHREEAFRIGVQLLTGDADAAQAGAAHAELAEACVASMTHAALVEIERKLGPQPGAFTVLGLGKFGGRELAEASDLDIMLVYDAPPDVNRAPGSAADFYTRTTQRLISALSAPTEEGALYEVDTQLRPSGSSGPVAVRLSSFERYYGEEAWTWEYLALTRLRHVGGDVALAERAIGAARVLLALPRDPALILSEVAGMRAKMERERRAKNAWDLKLAPGGFVDIEFIAQTLQLLWAHKAPDVLSANTGEALSNLCAAGALSAEQAETLLAAWSLWSNLHQAFRVCLDGAFDPETASEPLKEKLAEICGARNFAELDQRADDLRQRVRAEFVRIVGAPV